MMHFDGFLLGSYSFYTELNGLPKHLFELRVELLIHTHQVVDVDRQEMAVCDGLHREMSDQI